MSVYSTTFKSRLFSTLFGSITKNCCCNNYTGPYYLRASACEYNPPVPSDCIAAIRPDIWICVDATLLPANDTIRNIYAPIFAVGGNVTFTFIYNGWCYTVSYEPFSDGSNTLIEEDALATGLDLIYCDDSVTTVTTDCNDADCPTGIRFLLATRCDGGDDGEEDIYVCEASVKRAFTVSITTSSGAHCYCVKPGGTTTDLTSIPPGSQIYYDVCYPEDGGVCLGTSTRLVATYYACCQCQGGCSWGCLRRNPAHICCCSDTVTMVSYSTSWSTTRTQSNGNWQSVVGNGTAGVPVVIDGVYLLPVTWTFTSYRADLDPPVTTVQTFDDYLSPPNFECGFPFSDGYGYTDCTAGSWPPPTWCQLGDSDTCGFSSTPLQYGFLDQFGFRYLQMSFPRNGETGTFIGTANASCKSISCTLAGTITNTYDDGITEVLEGNFNVIVTYNFSDNTTCRGNCFGVTDEVL